MNLRLTIEEKYINALKTQNMEAINALRFIKSAIKNKDIENRSVNNKLVISDLEILSLLQSLIKQRKDSIEAFKLADRKDLILKEQNEISIISKFLPNQMNEEDIEKIISEIITHEKLSSLKDMGVLMNSLKNEYIGSVDMTIAGKIAKSLLNN